VVYTRDSQGAGRRGGRDLGAVRGRPWVDGDGRAHAAGRVLALDGALLRRAAGVIDECDGIVDKFLGDGAVALFIPGFAGSDHAADAIAAARGLLEQTGNGGPEPWISIGAGVHTGRSFVGAVGEGDVRDFTALGDAVNVAARLTGLAGAGEILVSAEAADAGGLETGGLERRTLELRGKGQTVDAWVATARM
jgi:adenylate cyclase